MSIDYDGMFGIGYEVTASDEITKQDLEDGLAEYINDKVSDEFEYFEVGEGCYTGDDNEIYIVVKDAFKDGLDLTNKKKALDDELKRLKVKAVGDFGDVGGLYVS